MLGSEVSVGPYVIIEKDAVVGNGSRLLSHSVIKKRTVLGIGVEVGHFAVVEVIRNILPLIDPLYLMCRLEIMLDWEKGLQFIGP